MMDRQLCASIKNGWHCTCYKDHSGEHRATNQAGGNGKIYAAWVNGPEKRTVSTGIISSVKELEAVPDYTAVKVSHNGVIALAYHGPNGLWWITSASQPYTAESVFNWYGRGATVEIMIPLSSLEVEVE